MLTVALRGCVENADNTCIRKALRHLPNDPMNRAGSRELKQAKDILNICIGFLRGEPMSAPRMFVVVRGADIDASL